MRATLNKGFNFYLDVAPYYGLFASGFAAYSVVKKDKPVKHAVIDTAIETVFFPVIIPLLIVCIGKSVWSGKDESYRITFTWTSAERVVEKD